ncbi:MAG: HAD-IIB family hydrolase [Ruminococcaceae bacterium]|nr:HAD-IIB family hydrolase [Oscillospiraceae bacterium]
MKNKYLFATDLDNTLIHSYKHKKDNDVCIEIYNGKEQGFCSKKTLKLLEELKEKILIVPVTARSIEQYKRIEWPEHLIPQFAVTSNGANLLINGIAEERWNNEMQEVIKPHISELENLQKYIEENFEQCTSRLTDEAFLVSAFENPVSAAEAAKKISDITYLRVDVSMRKVYMFPPELSKGYALERLKERFGCKRIFCAGDSYNDLDMLKKADYTFVPADSEIYRLNEYKADFSNLSDESFSEVMVEKMLNILKNSD